MLQTEGSKAQNVDYNFIKRLHSHVRHVRHMLLFGPCRRMLLFSKRMLNTLAGVHFTCTDVYPAPDVYPAHVNSCAPIDCHGHQ